jgi:uncharacterized protein (DUF2345 family)
MAVVELRVDRGAGLVQAMRRGRVVAEGMSFEVTGADVEMVEPGMYAAKSASIDVDERGNVIHVHGSGGAWL